jgi:O-acetyl-ADP-ribose deacetylase (regulator of RNase III)
MEGHIFITQGDITQLAVHAIAYSTSTILGGWGSMYPAFRDGVPGFADWFQQVGREHATDLRIGETFWMPLRLDTRPHGVVVVVAAGAPATNEDKAAIAVRAAIDEAVRNLRGQLGLKGQLLVALPAFRIGMGGDRDQQLRSARAQVASAQESLKRHPASTSFSWLIPQRFTESSSKPDGWP